jgi:hypothetical protein
MSDLIAIEQGAIATVRHNAPAILARLADGELIINVAAVYGVRPSDLIVALDKTPEWRLAYHKAREAGYDIMAEQTIQIADNAQNVDVFKASLQIRTRQWFLSKRKPTMYGDRVDINVTNKADLQQLRDKALKRVVASHVRPSSDQRIHEDPQDVDTLEESTLQPVDDESVDD